MKAKNTYFCYDSTVEVGGFEHWMSPLEAPGKAS